MLVGDTAGAGAAALRQPWSTGGDYYVAPLLRITGIARAQAGDTVGVALARLEHRGR